jgi:hypothetical protein
LSIISIFYDSLLIKKKGEAEDVYHIKKQKITTMDSESMQTLQAGKSCQ